MNNGNGIYGNSNGLTVATLFYLDLSKGLLEEIVRNR